MGVAERSRRSRDPIGLPVDELETPALVLDRSTAVANATSMGERMVQYSNCRFARSSAA